MTVLIACFSCNSFKINVNLDNSTGKNISLMKYDGDVLMTIDNAVAKDNKVVFKVKQSDNVDALHIMMEGWRRPFVFFADNQNVTVTGDCQKFNTLTAQGSESQARLEAFTAEFMQLEDENEQHAKAMLYVKENIDNPTGAYVLYRYKWAFLDSDVKSLLESIPAQVQSGYRYLTVNYLKELEKVSVGRPYTNIVQQDVEGVDEELASMVGVAKVIIIDFWASWCPDCRRENPELVKIYNEYSDKGLDIFSVSLDNNHDAWVKAIADDKLVWEHHVSDLKGWNNAAAVDYCISFIPQNVILDENGVIIKKNVPLNRMRELLDSILE